MKLTVNGKKAESSLHRRIDIDKWSNGKAIGNSSISKEVNKDIEIMQTRLYEIKRDLMEQGVPITAQKVISILNGGDMHSYKTVRDAIKAHNDMVLNLTGIDYAPATCKRYETTADHICNYIKTSYYKNDIMLSELNYEFMSGFEQYLKLVRKCNHNTTVKYIKNFKTIIHHALKNDWLSKDPFASYKCKTEQTIRPYLTQDEIDIIHNKDISIERLEVIKDVFLFSCYTGLAHVDVSNLKYDNIIEKDGHKLIEIYRTKTGVPSYIYLLPIALGIIEKYRDNPISEIRGTIFPIPSNQKTNAYLKEIAAICSIDKTLTYHMARHTFATTISMGNNISIEATGHSLGQRQIKTTQHYAKIEISKVINEYSKISGKYEKPISK